MSSEQPAGPVELVVPAVPASLALLRAVVAALAAGLDFTLDEIDDLRIAVDEAGSLLLPHVVPDSRLTAVFHPSSGGVRAEVSVTVSDGSPAEPDRSSFGWLVLLSLTGSTELVRAGRRLALVLTKDRAPRGR